MSLFKKFFKYFTMKFKTFLVLYSCLFTFQNVLSISLCKIKLESKRVHSNDHRVVTHGQKCYKSGKMPRRNISGEGSKSSICGKRKESRMHSNDHRVVTRGQKMCYKTNNELQSSLG